MYSFIRNLVGVKTDNAVQGAVEAIVRGVRTVGSTVANLVNFVNPGVVVIGGGVLRTGPEVYAELQQALFGRVTALAAQRLTVRKSSLDFKEGVIGAGILAIEQLFGPASLGLWIDAGSPIGHAASLQNFSIA